MLKEQFDKLYSDNITKKEYDQIISLIDERFGEIVVLICPNIMDGRGWFDYANCNYDSEDSNGKFDLDRYKNEIEIGGECSFPAPYHYSSCNGSIPTRWLWTNDEEILKEFKKEIQKEKDKVQKEKEQKLSKLTNFTKKLYEK